MAQPMSVTHRVDAIAEAMDLLGDEAPEELSDDVARCLAIASERNIIDPDAVLVALVGATGSGKSSLFNALIGEDAAAVSVVRPTTSAPMAATSASHDASALLEWLSITECVRIGDDRFLSDGVVLIDVPDIDSYAHDNHEEARRLTERVDLVIWVVDPQKYADDVIHSQWIRSSGNARGVSVVVLNQTDLLDDAARESVTRHLGQLVRDDGLAEAPIVMASTVTGEGIASLADLVSVVSRQVKAQYLRIHAALDSACHSIRSSIGLDSHLPSFQSEGLTGALTAAVSDAAGIDAIGADVAASYRHRCHRATGWKPVAWASTLRADPLSIRHLGRGATRDGASVPTHSALDAAGRARVMTAMRRVSDEICRGRPAPWSRSLNALASQSAALLPDAVDHLIARAPITVEKEPGWWRWASHAQWIAWLVTAASALWLTAVWALKEFLLIVVDLPLWRGIPIPSFLLLGGVLATVLIAGTSALASRAGARRAKRRALNAIRKRLAEEIHHEATEPLEAEDDRQRRIVAALERASR